MAVTLSLLTTLGGVVSTTTAFAAGTVLFQNTFNNRTVDGTGTVTKPTPTSGTNLACLTATGNSAALPLLSCGNPLPVTTDAQGSGKLRFTSATTNQVGGVFGQSSFPTSNGLDVTFNSYQWGGNNADGIAFMLAAVDPANPVPPTAMGSSGGALGYSAAPGLSGVTNAYLGVGLDVFGNFSNSSYSGTGCPGSIPNFGVAVAGTVAVRGPGNVRVGYCGLTTTYDGTIGSKLILRAATRAASVVPVQVLINPTGSPFTSDSGVSVTPGTYKVVVTPVGQPTKTLTGTLPTVAAGLYPSTSWLSTNGIPKQLAFGFVGSTGSVTDVHEISDVKVLTFNPVPQLAVATTSYAAATSGPGDPVTYRVVASVLSGQDEPLPISMTQTVPTGVKPVGAFGSGWVCQAPVGQAVTCTTSGSSFANGTALPAITVVAIVTGSNVTATFLQNNSTARASAADANPGTNTTTTAGSLPIAPSGITVTPAIGAIAGGGTVTVGGTNIAAATAIEIGTTAEQQAGTPITLLPCPGAPAPGCFTVSGSTLVISSMPARATSAPTSVTVVTSGVAAAATYIYADKPAAPATPTATAGITSATVSWAAPASNGSAITSYVVTPYLNGVAQTAQSFDTSTTTRSFTGLTAGGSYEYTVAAINAYGTSLASTKSATVIAYALPGAPAITAATAGTQTATLTWTAATPNGSAVTAYVLTPFIGTTAQTPQTFNSSATTQTVTGLTAGTGYTFTVAAQNAAGTGAPSAKSSQVIPNVSPSLAFAAPPAGEVGVSYSQSLAVAIGTGTSPFAYSVSGGTLPGGLTLNTSTGLLSGTPTSAGSFDFTVSVVDASNQSAAKAVTLVIAAPPTFTFTPAAGEVGVAYSQQPALSGGTGPFVWSITAGSLPAGVTLSSSSGLLSGTPTAAGTYSLTMAVTDGFAQVASKTVTLLIVALPAFTATPPAPGQVGVPYSTSLAVTGGTAPLAWSITAGSLPPGLTLSAGTGVLSGTPTTVGSSPFTVSVVDANTKTASKALTLVISAGPLVITKTANVSSTVAGGTVAYTVTITNTGSTIWSGASLSDPLPGVLDDAVYDAAHATATTGILTYTAPTLGWSGTIAALGTVTITYSVTVNNPDAGNKILSSTVTSSTLGANCASGSLDPRCSATVTVAGLTILKSADVATATPGSTVHFTVQVTNTGQTAYTGATLTDSLAGLLDDAAYNSDGATTSGNLSYTSPALTWTGNLAVGAAATITYSVTVTNPDTGDKSLTGTVVSPAPGSPCPSGNPAAGCTATVSVLVPALIVTSSADVSTTTPGGAVAYTMTLRNAGQTAYTGTSVTLDLAGALDDATYDNNAAASAGSIAYSAATRTLVWTGDLAIGATVTITASVTVRNPDPGDRTLTTSATSSAPGSTCPAGGSNPSCATSVQVRLPELTITKSADVGTTTPGSVVRYTVSVTNTGQTPHTAATFSDDLGGVLDDGAYNNDAATTAGAVSFTGARLTWTGPLAIGASATISYSVRVIDPDAGDRVLSNTVTSTTPGSTCPAGSSNGACTSTVTVLIPALSIVSAVEAPTTTPGAVVRYSVVVRNTGQTSYNGLAVTLNLLGAVDDASYNNDATITTGDLVTNPDGTVDWVLTLAPGASATGTISMTVNDPDIGNKSVLITAVSGAPGSPCKSGSPAPSCNAVAAVLVPALTITKTANVSTVTPGERVDYTILVVNNGQTTYPAASFTDDLTTVLTDATYGGNAAATSGSVTYTAPALSWSGALAPGASATITYSVTVRDPDPGDKRMYNTVVSSAAGNNCEAGSADTRCTSTVYVLVPRLTIVKTANSPTTAPGGVVGYTITVTNSGATSYTGAAFADSLTGVLDDATYNTNAAATSGAASFAGSTLTWTGDLAVGASATITYTVTVRAPDGGDHLLTNTLTSSTRGTNCAAGSLDARCTNTVKVAALLIQQNYAGTSTTPGSLVHLSATFTNTGQVPYTGITITSPSADTVDDAVPTGDESATSGTLALSASAITWTGSIPVGGAVTITGTLTVKDPDTGNKLITGTLVSAAPGNNCPAGGTDARCTALTSVLIPALTITKTADTTATVPGGKVGYTITVHNTGQTAYNAASVTDSLAGVLDEASYDGNAVASTGTVTFSAPTLSWSGDLAVGASASITYSVSTQSAPAGDYSLFNTVTSTDVGSTCRPASGNPACQSLVDVLTPQLTIVKTADLANATLGSTVTYTVKVTNSGQTAHPAAAFTDSLAGVLDDATYNPGATTTTSGTVSYASGVLSWSGALNPGVSATITYTVTINISATGDKNMSNTVTSTTSGSNCAAGVGDGRCTATVAVTNSVTLTFTKTANVTSTVAGAVVRYTVTAANSSAAPVASANFTDPLSGILDDATYNTDATVTGTGTLGYSAPNLTWTGPVPALGSITVTYSVTVHGAVTGDQILAGTISSTSPPVSNDCLAASSDPRCTNAVPIARLELSQVATETTTTPGSVVHLIATYTNTGKVAYNDIFVASPRADTADDTSPTEDQSATSGILDLTPSAITWTGSIPVGGKVTVTRTLTVKDPDPGNQLITAKLVSDLPGNNCPSGSADPGCTFLTTVLTPQLMITKTANTTFVLPGGSAAYTITITNTGQTPYTGATLTDTLVGVLDDATYDGNAAATAGAVAFTSPNLTWAGDLPVGASATITYSVTAHNPATGDKTMVNPVSSTTVGSTCPPASGNTPCRSTVAVLTPALTITSAASAATSVPGTTLTYTLTATNTGQVPYGAASFTVPLAGVLDDATYNGDAAATAGTVGVVGQTLTWTGLLGTGAAASITYTVRVNNPDNADHRLDQMVTSTTSGNNCPAAGSDPRCATSVPIANLRIVNGVDVTTTKPTAVVRSTGTFTNTGQVPYVGISISFDAAGTLDDATYNGDGATSAGDVAGGAGGRITWTGDLAVGKTVTITSSVTVNNPDAGNKNLDTVFTTDAAASNCPTGGTDPVCATSVQVLTPALTITKTADTTTATPGSRVTYTITVNNTGPTPYTAATVTDPLNRGVLDGATYSNDATATTGVVSYTAPTLTWTGNLAVSQIVTITFSVVVNSPYLGDGTILNTVISDELGSTCPTTGPATTCAVRTPVHVPVLEIAVTADSTTTVPGAIVAYTVTVHNTGESAYAGASVTTSLAGELDDATYNTNAAASAGLVSFATPNLTWTGDIAVDAIVTINYTVTVADPDLGNKSLATSVTSAAVGSLCTTASPCVNTVTVLVPELVVSTAADVSTATPGDQVLFTITVANTGQTPYTGTVLSTTLSGILDDASLDGPVNASAGVATYTAPDLTWTGTLHVGDSATITLTATVREPDPGDKAMSMRVVAPAAGSTCQADSTNPACTASVTVLIPKLTITKTASAPTTTPGGVVGYTIVATNTGQTDYTAATITDSLTGVLPDSVYNGDAVVVGGGTLDYTAPTLTWTGALSIGARTTITYSITVHDPDPGDKNMTNNVTSTTPGSTCPPGGSLPDCSTQVRVLVPELVITKTADTATVVAGSAVTYTITVANTGQTPYPAAAFTDSLAGVLDDASYAGAATASTGSFGYTNSTLSWTGALAVGATATITYTVTTKFPATGDHTLANTVLSNSLGSNCTTGTTDPRCSSTVSVLVPKLDVTKTADTLQVVAGGTVHYTITATNTGEANYPAAEPAVLTDSLAAVLDHATYSGNAVANAGAVVFASPTLTWTGGLVIGATVTITYSVTTNLALTGDALMTNRVVSATVGNTCTGAAVDPCLTTTTVIARSITLSGLTPSFTLTGLPNDTVSTNGAVTMTVTTNSPGGYQVTVQAGTALLTGALPGNTETVPIGRLGVRDSESLMPGFQAMSAATSNTVHQQNAASQPGGDAVGNDYQIKIPFVPADTYTATLDYIVTAQ